MKVGKLWLPVDKEMQILEVHKKVHMLEVDKVVHGLVGV